MRLKDSFFETISHTAMETTGGVHFQIKLNSSHPIYGNHFPGNPITPGVCLIQIVKELTEELAKKPLHLSVVTRARYYQAINPILTPEVDLTLLFSHKEPAQYEIEASFLAAAEQVLSQFKLLFTHEEH